LNVKKPPPETGFTEGVVLQKNDDGSCDFEYSDGTIEKAVDPSRVAPSPQRVPTRPLDRPVQPPTLTTSMPSRLIRPNFTAAEQQNAAFRFGAKVAVKQVDGSWLKGYVISLSKEGLVDVQLDNGKEQKHVDPNDVRLQLQEPQPKSGETEMNEVAKEESPSASTTTSSSNISSRFLAGTLVEALGASGWFMANITLVRLDGTYDIVYENGDIEENVKDIRFPGGLEVDSLVEANYRGHGTYYPGKIRRIWNNGTYDIEYNDGKKEEKVQLVDIRKKGMSKFQEGTKVEAIYFGTGRYLAGKVRRDRGDGTYDIDYEDGSNEVKVKEENIHLLKEGESEEDKQPIVSGGSVSIRPRFENGSKVEANYRGQGSFIPGRISRVRFNDTYDIDYDGGELETEVKESDIRLLDGERPSNDAPKFTEGSKVEANLFGMGKYYPAKIRRVREDGTYDIDYDNGSLDLQVTESYIRWLEESSPGPGVSRSAAKLEEGMDITANYLGKGKHYPGRMGRERGDVTFYIIYDDGETELKVKEADIRFVARWKVGCKVDGNYNDCGNYYPGKIKRKNEDGTYQINYDDGEVELSVEDNQIRLLGGRKRGLPKWEQEMEMEVEVQGKYYPGLVLRDWVDGTYGVEIDEMGEMEVKEAYIRLPSNQNTEMTFTLRIETMRVDDVANTGSVFDPQSLVARITVRTTVQTRRYVFLSSDSIPSISYVPLFSLCSFLAEGKMQRPQRFP
jgi:hypothetical protein